jgi:hypothetical protein
MINMQPYTLQPTSSPLILTINMQRYTQQVGGCGSLLNYAWLGVVKNVFGGSFFVGRASAIVTLICVLFLCCSLGSASARLTLICVICTQRAQISQSICTFTHEQVVNVIITTACVCCGFVFAYKFTQWFPTNKSNAYEAINAHATTNAHAKAFNDVFPKHDDNDKDVASGGGSGGGTPEKRFSIIINGVPAEDSPVFQAMVAPATPPRLPSAKATTATATTKTTSTATTTTTATAAAAVAAVTATSTTKAATEPVGGGGDGKKKRRRRKGKKKNGGGAGGSGIGDII